MFVVHQTVLPSVLWIFSSLALYQSGQKKKKIKLFFLNFSLFSSLFCSISLAMLGGMQNLSSPTRIKLVPPEVEARSLNHWTTREDSPSPVPFKSADPQA